VGGEFNTKAQGHKGHKVQRVFGFLGGWNPHCRLQRQHGTFPEASLMSKLNGTLQGKFLFQKQVFEMRVPPGKLTVIGIPPSLEMREQNGDWQRRGALPFLFLSFRLRLDNQRGFAVLSCFPEGGEDFFGLCEGNIHKRKIIVNPDVPNLSGVHSYF